MATTFRFLCFPWDLLDEGLESALDSLRGEIGVDVISISAVHSGIAEFRSRPGFAPRVFRTQGGMQFQPEAARYVDSRLRPVTASWIKSRNPLEQIAKEAERHNLRVRARCNCCYSPLLVERHQDAACRNAFGDRSSTMLCPTNPDVRECVAALVADLSVNYPLDAIELETAHFGAANPASDGVITGLVPSLMDNWLLSLCFCESCVQRAAADGLDVAATRRCVQVLLEPTLAGSTNPTAGSLAQILADPLLAAWQQMHLNATTELIAAARRTETTPLVLLVPRDPFSAAFDASAVGPYVDAFAVSSEQETNRVRPAKVADLIRLAGGAARIEPEFSCCPPACTNGASLVRTVHDAVHHGHATIGFENYGLATAAGLDWARQAIRFARRESRETRNEERAQQL